MNFPLESFNFTLSNGLQCCFIPRKGILDNYASLAVKFGSYHTYLPNQKTIPLGTAHFLEHLIFSAEALKNYQPLGTFANATTNYDKTTYSIQFSTNIQRNIYLLFDIVFQLKLTSEQIENERKIIQHELRNISDKTEWISLYYLLETMYFNNPIRNPIGGNMDSLYDINLSILQDCFQYYYQPSNMFLFVTGDFQIEELKKYVEDYNWLHHFNNYFHYEIPFYSEPTISRKKIFEQTSLISSSPYYLRGWKFNFTYLQGQQLMEESLKISILLEAIFGKTSRLYEKLNAEALISNDFEWQFESFPGLGTAIVGGYTTDTHLIDRYIVDYIEMMKKSGFDPEDLERIKRHFIGMYVRCMDEAHQLATIFNDWQARGANLVNIFYTLINLDLYEIDSLLKQLFICENSSVVVLSPKSEGSK